MIQINITTIEINATTNIKIAPTKIKNISAPINLIQPIEHIRWHTSLNSKALLKLPSFAAILLIAIISISARTIPKIIAIIRIINPTILQDGLELKDKPTIPRILGIIE